MANKEVTKKEVKKQRRRMKRSVRKTLGALFLASAVAVAAIPTDNLEAKGSETNRTAPSITRDSSTIIPHFEEGYNGDTIYTDGDGIFRFAMRLRDTDLAATILGYTGDAIDGPVTIPDEVQPYVKFTNYTIEGNGYVAVGQAGNFLYWKESHWETKNFDHLPTADELAEYRSDVKEEPKVTDTSYHDDVTDLDVPRWTVQYEVIDSFNPCYANTISQWEDIPASELYYDGKNPEAVPGQGNLSLSEEDAVKTTSNSYQPVKAKVRYIGSQYLVDYVGTSGKVDGAWMIGGDVKAENKDKTDEGLSGVFAGNTNIKELIVGPNLLGIGDYAFYGCGYLGSITLANGLEIIGEGAFEQCYNMTEVNLEVGSNLGSIAQRAFYGCRRLDSFTLPLGVTTICDSAFEGCTALRTIDLLSAGYENALREFGRDVFRNCSSLQNITFPTSVTGDVYLSIFDGCSSLQYISTRSWDINFVEDGTGDDKYYSYADFRDALLGEGTTVNGTFYFEGIAHDVRASGISRLHEMTEENCFAFSYLKDSGITNASNPNDIRQNKYELTVQENPESSDGDGRAHYVVNTSNEMIGYWAAANVTNVTIPSKIGPYTVSSISSTTFQTKCYIVKVYIPANVTSISADAFRGCHNLKNVIFESENIVIGDNAFKTQDTPLHEGNCKTKDTMTNSDGSPAVQLNFIGPISAVSGSYQYAMSSRGIYSNDTQKVSYITYLTGWPQNMEIRYNPETGMSELVDLPSFSELTSAGSKYYQKDESGNYNYVYMTDDYVTAMMSAATLYQSEAEPSRDVLDNTLQGQAYKSVMEIEIPEGVESVKDGLFKEKEDADVGILKNTRLKTVTAHSLKRITNVETDSVSGGDAASVTGTFSGCAYISSIQLLGGVETIETHAFMNCTGLIAVKLPATVKEMGTRPFAGCSKLSVVNFSGGPYFECDNSIIYELEDQTRTKVVECLEGRSYPEVEADEMDGITALYPEAFMGTQVVNIDLSMSSVSVIPEKAFMNNSELTTVKLPNLMSGQTETGRVIQKDAFANCPRLISLTIPGVRTQFYMEGDGVFGGTTLRDGKTLWFYCEEGSDAALYAEIHRPYIDWKEKPTERYWNVRFGYRTDDENKTFIQIGETQSILEGGKAIPPEDSEVPEREGYVFTGWDRTDYLTVYENMDVVAQYSPASEVIHTVAFLYEDMTPYYTQRVVHGQDAIPMQPPYKQGYVFIGWRVVGGDGSVLTEVKDVRSDMSLVPVYREAEDGEDDGSGTQTKDPNATEDPNATQDPNSTNDPNGSGSGSGTDGTSGTFYILTVQNGSGSGSYREGDQPVIIANEPASGQEFAYWTISPDSTKIASTALSATIVTMPASDVTVTAHYRARTGSGTGTGSGTTGSGNTNRPNGSGTSGTTVVIDKNGLSNTGVVSATVHGSSDNFVIKITESNAATEAALRALMAEYGSLDNIVYFPMDISLYDSTGTTKITDTTGLSIDITLPLPDSMITYAGNNQVAGVVNDKLDRLSARFSTIQGVSCITFTATHFSPYVIYVDTGNLSSGLVSDSTPKTGDGIHPKWFLSIGLACLSFVFFMQTDGRKPKKVKVKVRA